MWTALSFLLQACPPLPISRSQDVSFLSPLLPFTVPASLLLFPSLSLIIQLAVRVSCAPDTGEAPHVCSLPSPSATSMIAVPPTSPHSAHLTLGMASNSAPFCVCAFGSRLLLTPDKFSQNTGLGISHPCPNPSLSPYCASNYEDLPKPYTCSLVYPITRHRGWSFSGYCSRWSR